VCKPTYALAEAAALAQRDMVAGRIEPPPLIRDPDNLAPHLTPQQKREACRRTAARDCATGLREARAAGQEVLDANPPPDVRRNVERLLAAIGPDEPPFHRAPPGYVYAPLPTRAELDARFGPYRETPHE
jgi:hypothetical protein